ncbi:DUF349 domain-containing protein [Corynebacterium atypicum]|nr:DUF349 domain-containing protein [Corynebacterium atypicum]
MSTDSTNRPTPSPDPHSPRRPSPGAMPGRIPRPGTHHSQPAANTPKPAPSAPSAASQPHISSSKATKPEPPEKFGRIDQDGTVIRFDQDGERVVGQWQAGTVADGLAHFALRYQDLATKVAVLGSRLDSHPEDAKSIKKQAQTIREGLGDAAVIGDIAALDHQLVEISHSADAAGERARTEQQRRREAAIARREELIAEAEDIAANSTQWKAAGDRIRGILDEWRTIRGIDRATDDALWRRYARARDAFHRRRGAHFAQLDKERAAERRTKEELVERAEALQDSTNWRDTARDFRELMQEWKAAGRAPRDVDDKLWARFRAAQDHFFDARRAVEAEKDREFEANAEAKRQLIAEYQPLITPEKNLRQACAHLAQLQEKWDEIGFVPRGEKDELEAQIAGIEKRVSEAENAQWRHTDPRVHARVDQFRQRAADFERQAAQARENGQEKKAVELEAQASQWSSWAQTAAQAAEDR